MALSKGGWYSCAVSRPADRTSRRPTFESVVSELLDTPPAPKPAKAKTKAVNGKGEWSGRGLNPEDVDRKPAL